MDFMNRNNQPQAAQASAPQPSSPSVPVSPVGASRNNRPAGGSTNLSGQNKMFRAASVALLFALTILVVSVIGIIFVNTNRDQNKFVKTDSYQAVFLTNGQVYFGKLNEVGHDYFRLNNIYYLTQNSTSDSKGNATTDGNYTLVKLGCQQIHDPLDQMIIERSQVSFWENLESSQYSKVVKSIGDYQTQNKTKTKAELCATTSNQTQASPTTNTQGGSSASTGGSTTPTSPTAKIP